MAHNAARAKRLIILPSAPCWMAPSLAKWGSVAKMPAMSSFTLHDLQAYLDQHVPDARLLPDIGHTPTVPAAAAVLGVDPEQIIKTLLFVLRPGPTDVDIPQAVVVIGCGAHRIDKKTLARHFGIATKRAKFATPDQVLDLLGYPAGGVPPFGHRTPLPVLLDQRILTLRERFAGQIFGGGGDDRTMLALTVDDLIRIHAPTVLPLSESIA